MRIQMKRICGLVWLAVVLALCTTASSSHSAAPATGDFHDDLSPWGMVGSPGVPLLPETGNRWVRAFGDWERVQPTQGQWNWAETDKVVADARANHINVLGYWWYFAPWASADGGTRRGPIKDMQFFKDYVTGTVSRYHGNVKYWEVWNEFNGSFYEGGSGNRARDYADLVVAAYDAAKQVDPTVKVGMSVASSDIGFLDLAIKAGAANHFDFICIHPYENLDAMTYSGDEAGFLTLGNTLRLMLAQNKQPISTPLWITEVGHPAPVKPDPQADALQASIIVKSYILPLAQGFQRIFWFCFPSWGDDTGDYGLVRPDKSTRPSYIAYKTMISLLGMEPKYEGWVNLGKDGHGFLFRGQSEDVLAAWALPGKEESTAFKTDVRVTDLTGKESNLTAGMGLALTGTPVFLRGLPASLVEQGNSNRNKPFPWDRNYAHARNATLSIRPGETNDEHGLRRIFLGKEQEGLTEPATVNGESCLRVVSKDHDNNFAYFRADPSYIPFGRTALDITVKVRRLTQDQAAGIAITYETLEGYKDFQKGFEPWTIPAGDAWQEHTWHVNDASFADKWGWHLGLVSTGTGDQFLIKEVSITKSHR